MRFALIIPLLCIAFKEVSLKPLGDERGGRVKRSGYTSANQTLHRLINTAPVDSLVLRYPQFNNETNYGIVLLVISAEWEKAERAEIRKQWAAVGESEMQKTGKSIVIFLVGRSSDLEEVEDLLQVDIEESYRNLVYKNQVGFRWVQEKIQSEFVAKIDSDTVVAIDRLYKGLRGYEEEGSGDGAEDWIACSTYSGSKPVRDDTNKWYVPTSDYPSDSYPRYCNGPAYVMPSATLDKIVIEVEDVFFTGVVRADLAISFIDKGLTAHQYTSYSDCDSNGAPTLAILNTHYQFGWHVKYKKDLTAAWRRLKKPYCNDYLPSYHWRWHG